MGLRPVTALVVAVFTTGCGQSGPPVPTPTPAPPQTTQTAGPPEELRPRLRRITKLEQPLALATREGDPALYVAQKTGEVVAIRRGGATDVVLDLSGEVSRGTEQGLLGLAFAPYGRFLYVNFTDAAGDTRILEYATSDDGVDAGSRREVLSVDQPHSNHNGGNLAFGPDGYLYVGLGDGGSAGDPQENAQDLGTLLGKMLRIDPRPSGGRPYGIPDDNPFVGREGARPEVWAYGLRNPWRYSFDRLTGDLWIGDVGEGRREEIDVQPGSSGGGENYGWDALEGDVPFEGDPPPDAVPPVHAYGRSVGASVVGGYVYRGEAVPALRGTYVFADFYNAELMMLRARPGGGLRGVPLGPTAENVASFGEDRDGELYVLSLAGPVYRITG